MDEFDDFGIDDAALLAIDMPDDTPAAEGIAATSQKNVTNASAPPLTGNPKKRAMGTPVGLIDTLERHYGYTTFRPGQRNVVEAVLDGSDAAVFWATGQGKSLCYQLPALHTGRTAVVVSPLISLMQDQCARLNGSVGQGGHDIATFLGSSQADASAERRALAGEFLLVYVTPEKLVSGDYFLDALANLHAARGLSLIAVDEAHCVSSWGHDFRPEFRQLDKIREKAGLNSVPLMALTATAVPRVQTDIIHQLRLRQPHIAKQSFDRTNLRISCHRKPITGGYAVALEPLVKHLCQQPLGNSTIIYAPTRTTVDALAAHMETELDRKSQHSGTRVVVKAYHAGLSPLQRQAAHEGFLVGAVQVIVATVAFGMGIDKPDTRRVVHWGAPKTVEEYYQQIGRAGRDGLTAECAMYANDADFNKYDSEFYMQGLDEAAQQTVRASTRALRDYALNSEHCRRRELLRFFDEDPAFGMRCGTCDNCERAKQFAGDLQRDFGPVARVCFLAVQALKQATMTSLTTLLSGKVLKDAWRYNYASKGPEVQLAIQRAKELQASTPSTKQYPRTASFYKELFDELVNRKFLVNRTEKGGYQAYTCYELSPLAVKALNAPPGTPAAQVMLPVPAIVRKIQEDHDLEVSKVKAELTEAGVDVRLIPQAELDEGKGETIDAYKFWYRTLRKCKNDNRLDKLSQLQELKKRIAAWRTQAAQALRMAPASVMAEHLVCKVAYVAHRGPVAEQALRAVGVRVGQEAGTLAKVIEKWCAEFGVQPICAGAASSMVFSPANDPFTPAQPWQHAVYKPAKKTGMATWESSYQRFQQQGQHPDAIALNPVNGKAIQAATVIGHVLQALLHGKPVHLSRLAAAAATCKPPPSTREWAALEAAETATSIDVVGAATFEKGALMREIVNPVVLDTPFADRSEEDRALLSRWYGFLDWFCTFRRTGYRPTFESSPHDEQGNQVAFGGGAAAKKPRHC